MIITVETIVSFDSMNERNEIEKFMEENDMTNWTKSEATLMTSFTSSTTYYQMKEE